MHARDVDEPRLCDCDSAVKHKGKESNDTTCGNHPKTAAQHGDWQPAAFDVARLITELLLCQRRALGRAAALRLPEGVQLTSVYYSSTSLPAQTNSSSFNTIYQHPILLNA